MDFGIIVDGAVIVLENIFRELSEAPAGDQRRRGSDGSSRPPSEVGRPTMFSMLIIIIAHIPIFTLQRQEGRIFAPMAYTVVSALIGSLLVFADTGAGAVPRSPARGLPARGERLGASGARACIARC